MAEHAIRGGIECTAAHAKVRSDSGLRSRGGRLRPLFKPSEGMLMEDIQRQPPIKILILRGDGIGPEITEATVHVLDQVQEIIGTRFVYDYQPIGFEALALHGTSFPQIIIDTMRDYDGIILGPVSHFDYPPASEGGLNPSGELRKRLDLYANIRPALSRPGLPPRCGESIDLVIVRENTEGFYADRSLFQGSGEFMPTPDLAMSFRKISRLGSTRIAVSAFELAKLRRSKVTAVHKANVLRVCDGLFLECVREVAAAYPDVEYEERIVDAMAALLVRDPAPFDVIVTTNMFGDILSDLASEISGSLGLAASLNTGIDMAVAQAQHGSAPDIAGQNKANPGSLIGSAAMLLRWLSERRGNARLAQAGDLIDRAMSHVLAVPETRTSDLGGNLGTREFAACVSGAMHELSSTVP